MTDESRPLSAEDVGCQYCWADPRYTKIADDKKRRCPVCGADYTGPRRPNLLALAGPMTPSVAERLELSPWARAAISFEERDALRSRIPALHQLRIAGRGRRWSAYLVARAGCVASVQGAPSWRAAVDAVLGA